MRKPRESLERRAGCRRKQRAAAGGSQTQRKGSGVDIGKKEKEYAPENTYKICLGKPATAPNTCVKPRHQIHMHGSSNTYRSAVLPANTCISLPYKHMYLPTLKTHVSPDRVHQAPRLYCNAILHICFGHILSMSRQLAAPCAQARRTPGGRLKQGRRFGLDFLGLSLHAHRLLTHARKAPLQRRR